MSTPPCPPSAARPAGRHSGRRRPWSVRTGMLTVGVGAMVALLPTVLLPVSGWAASGAGGGPGRSGGQEVRGVVERLSVERQTGGSDQPHRTASVTSWLRTATGRIRLADDALPGVPAGATVAVRLAAPVRAQSVQDGTPATTSTGRRVGSVRVLSTGITTSPLTGGHEVTVLLALPTGGTKDATTAASLAAAITGPVSSFWSRQTGGRVRFTVSKAIGWTALAGSCADVWGLWDAARAKAGFVPGPRRHLMIYVPPSAGCPTGLGTIGAGPATGGYTLIGGLSTGLLAHELGHNLGLGHSNALRCPGRADGTPTGTGYAGGCQQTDYGDWYDVMGISWDNLGTLSTAHAYQLGLLGPADVRTVSGPARVLLHAVSDRTGLRSLRVADPTGALYVVEYRPALGADAWLGTPADWRGLQPGVLVRRVDPADPTQTLLLDATPSDTVTTEDWDVVLTAGHGLVDASGRVEVRVEATTSSTAVVTVSVDRAGPGMLAESGGKLVNGVQVTIGEAPAVWAGIH